MYNIYKVILNTTHTHSVNEAPEKKSIKHKKDSNGEKKNKKDMTY